jgi:tRNA A-37 threonylcarbamoyl transferase component Bud32
MPDTISRLRELLAGRYRIEGDGASLLGQGGMATVYLAHDVKHDRKVALKVLRPELAAVLGAERFLQEIKTTANLQHPHILPLHDSGEVDGTVFYVMPFVEGESLRDRLAREKQLPVEEAVRIAREVASALDYAHRHGVIHRDIKPENILLHDGQALVADFGIALAASSVGGSRMTETGMSLGTPHYMSPEQAMGEREITVRSDVYALGCVLYEMLTGEPPFTGPTAQAIVAKVMTAEPAGLTLQRKTVPPHVEAAVLTALEKLPADRFASAAEFSAALGNPGFVAKGAVVTAQVVSRRRHSAVVVVAFVVLAGVALWGWFRSPASAPRTVMRFEVVLPASEQLYEAPLPLMDIAPDGSGFVYVGMGPQGRRLYWRGFNRFANRPLVGTEDAENPFFSPDGAWVGYRARNRMYKISMAGGAPQEILSWPFTGAEWGADGRIIFGGGGDSTGLFEVSADGGTPKRITTVDAAKGELDHRSPCLLPGGRHAVFEVTTTSTTRIAAVDLANGAITYLTEGRYPSYAPSGHLVYMTRNGPRVIGFDPKRLVVRGSESPVEPDGSPSGDPMSEVHVSANGTLAYLTRDANRRLMVEVDRLGRERVLSPDLRGYDSPRYSPDGKRLAVRIQDSEGFHIWIFDFARGTSLRLTFDRSSYYPEWTPDGLRIAYPSTVDGETGIWWKSAGGGGAAERFYDPPQAQWESSWSRSGRYVVIRQNDSVTGRDLWLVSLPDRKPTPLLVTPASEHSPALSPDGRYLAYVSNATGRAEVYVRTVPDSSGTWLVSESGGGEPRWSANGRELFYRAGEAIMSVGFQAQPTVAFGKRDTVFAGAYVPNPNHSNFDVHPSGDRFVMVRMSEGERRAVIVMNWDAELARRTAGE